MGKKLTNEEYVAKLAQVNPSVVAEEEYIDSKTKIWHRCLIDEYRWKVKPAAVLFGYGCPKCSHRIQMTNGEFVTQLATINPNIEPLEPYVNMKTKILCRCKVDGYKWRVTPEHLLYRKHGCPMCAGNKKRTKEEYLEFLATNKPNIIMTGEFLGSNTKTEHTCLIDGHVWYPTPNSIIFGHNCPMCSGKATYTTERFVKKVESINPDVEILGEYINAYTKVLCRCKICDNTWLALPISLFRACGCPLCNQSSGEGCVSRWLKSHGIDFIPQYTFDKCRYKHKLPFDFYLPNHNMCIEYDGGQHFQPVAWFGGQEEFEKIQKRDAIKTQYCKDNNIKLLRIKFDENIDFVLDDFFNNINNTQ